MTEIVAGAAEWFGNSDACTSALDADHYSLRRFLKNRDSYSIAFLDFCLEPEAAFVVPTPSFHGSAGLLRVARLDLLSTCMICSV